MENFDIDRLYEELAEQDLSVSQAEKEKDWSRISHGLDLFDEKRKNKKRLLFILPFAMLLLGSNFFWWNKVNTLEKNISNNIQQKRTIVFDTIVKHHIIQKIDTIRKITIIKSTIYDEKGKIENISDNEKSMDKNIFSTVIKKEQFYNQSNLSGNENIKSQEIILKTDTLTTEKNNQKIVNQKIEPIQDSTNTNEKSTVTIEEKENVVKKEEKEKTEEEKDIKSDITKIKPKIPLIHTPTIGIDIGSSFGLKDKKNAITDNYKLNFGVFLGKKISLYAPIALQINNFESTDSLKPLGHNNPFSSDNYKYKYTEISNLKILRYGLQINYHIPLKNNSFSIGLGLNNAILYAHEVKFEYMNKITGEEKYIKIATPQTKIKAESLNFLASATIPLNNRLSAKGTLLHYTFLKPNDYILEKSMWQINLGLSYKLK